MKLIIRDDKGILVATITNKYHITQILTSAIGEWKTGKYEQGMKNYLLVKEGFTFTVGNAITIYVWENYRIFSEK